MVYGDGFCAFDSVAMSEVAFDTFCRILCTEEGYGLVLSAAEIGPVSHSLVCQSANTM